MTIKKIRPGDGVSEIYLCRSATGIAHFRVFRMPHPGLFFNSNVINLNNHVHGLVYFSGGGSGREVPGRLGANEHNHPDQVQGLDRHISDQITEHRLYLISPQAFSTSKVSDESVETALKLVRETKI